MIKIVELCSVCGGKGKFLTQNCPTCGGNGGSLLKFNKDIENLMEQKKEKLSEREVAVIELYKSGFSLNEIAKNMNLGPTNVVLILHQIEEDLS